LPFTPFHLGPALAIGLPLRKIIHTPTFIIANLIIDIEPFTVMILRLRYPLHGYLHTFISAIIVGILLGYFMYKLEKLLHELYDELLLTPIYHRNLKPYIIAGTTGTVIHVLLDSPMYYDIKPFCPLTINPLFNPELTIIIYELCGLMFIAGIIYYILLLIMYKGKH